MEVSPVGTTEAAPRRLSRPYGTIADSRDGGPSDKSLGYCRMSLRDRLRLEAKLWVRTRASPQESEDGKRLLAEGHIYPSATRFG